MSEIENEDMHQYYSFVLDNGRLRTEEHARLWSKGVLETLGINLDRRTKGALSKAIPDELAASLRGVFWLLHFRDPELSSYEFRQRAARRSGNTDAEFALYPTLAVFGAIKHYTDNELDIRISDALSPEVRELWLQAEVMEILA